MNWLGDVDVSRKGGLNIPATSRLINNQLKFQIQKIVVISKREIHENQNGKFRRLKGKLKAIQSTKKRFDIDMN